MTRCLVGQLPRGAVHELVSRSDDPWVVESLDRSVMVKPIGGLSAALNMRANEFKGLGISNNERPCQQWPQRKLGLEAVGDT